uniref:Uncharacterized protein n=1 Tax=Kuenenia stuttgartiensis TaxID=174633 RepID=Q1Q6A6_KUEST|nr:unknown protein [Candidatus Kuenenia stuttgartiensis]
MNLKMIYQKISGSVNRNKLTASMQVQTCDFIPYRVFFYVFLKCIFSCLTDVFSYPQNRKPY